MSSLPAGASFAGYTIVRWLGTGPFADVYLAEHPRPPGRYALKIPSTTRTQDRASCLRFCREGALALHVRHPNLVALHDVGEFCEHVWAAREYVEGITAADLIHRFPQGLPAQGVAAIVSGIGAALDHLHSAGHWHHAVRPGNILLTDLESSEPRGMLCDFATSCRSFGRGPADLDKEALAYAAPEDVLDAAAADFRVDQYALAASALDLLTGRPTSHADLTAVLTQLVSAPPPRPSDRRPELARLDRAFSIAMAKNPADRFGSCREFAAELARASVG